MKFLLLILLLLITPLLLADDGVTEGVPGLDDGTPGTPVYPASDCIGTVIMGVCHGTILSVDPMPPRCHGTMLDGECIGVLIP